MMRFFASPGLRGLSVSKPGRRPSQRSLRAVSKHTSRQIHHQTSSPTSAEPSQEPPSSQIASSKHPDGIEWDIFKNSLKFPPATNPDLLREGAEINVHGFLGKRRDKRSNLSFCDIDLRHTPQSTLRTLQIVSSWEELGSSQHDAHASLKAVPPYSPVCVTGTLQKMRDPQSSRKLDADSSNIRSIRVTGVYHEPGQSRQCPGNPGSGTDSQQVASPLERFELKLHSIHLLNQFPKDIIVSKSVEWPAQSRHLKIRFDSHLHERLEFRNAVADTLRQHLKKENFLEVETPLLFRTTPEGAREFLVPVREGGRAYALPQSPQQYKQILMASGVHRYFQFAKCFRDEDHRADRQPEFTQLDLEMAFATGEDVRQTIENLMCRVFEMLHSQYAPTFLDDGTVHPQLREFASRLAGGYERLELPIHRMSYHTAMRRFGTDKPDLRIESPIASDIVQVGDILPRDFVSKITKLENPVIEAIKFRFEGEPSSSSKFVQDFFDTLPKTVNKLADTGAPGVFVVNSSKPLQGLFALGHEAADKFLDLDDPTWTPCEDGDIVIVHAREHIPTQGGSTELGRLRKLIYDAAIEQGLLPRNHDLRFLFVDDFPLFTPMEPKGGDLGQGGKSGFSATHHPFTAPKTAADVELLPTDPLRVIADHYDLVLNGVEIGGGSRRIHVAEVQEYIMRDVLQMSDQGVKKFSHLLEALRAGCPPHAGFAFGFDRLISVLCDVPSVRDVIAFPKNNAGKDRLVGSPTTLTAEERADLRQRVGDGPFMS
ncbi:tRNA synthetases class II-domain-containing protein [Xylariaceae sp. FL0255]|nr:tRNA synthetases class II-domain-containing protein [Xylariaceae sp. FL0255]